MAGNDRLPTQPERVLLGVRFSSSVYIGGEVAGVSSLEPGTRGIESIEVNQARRMVVVRLRMRDAKLGPEPFTVEREIPFEQVHSMLWRRP